MASDVTIDYTVIHVWISICSIYASLFALTAIIVLFLLRKRRTHYVGTKECSPQLASLEFRNLPSNKYKPTNEVRTTSKRNKVVDFSDSVSGVNEKTNNIKTPFLKDETEDVQFSVICSDTNDTIGDTSGYFFDEWQEFEKNTKGFSFKDKFQEDLHPCHSKHAENSFQCTNDLNFSIINPFVEDQKISSYDTAFCLKYCPKINVSVSSISTGTESLQLNDDQMAVIMVNSLISPVKYSHFGSVNLHKEEILDSLHKKEFDSDFNVSCTSSEQIDIHQEKNYILNVTNEQVNSDSKLSLNQVSLCNNCNVLSIKPTSDVSHEISLYDKSDKLSVMYAKVFTENVFKDVEDMFYYPYTKKIPTATLKNNVVDILGSSAHLYDNIISRSNFSEKLLPEKRKTSVFIDKAGNISITLTPMEIFADNSFQVPVRKTKCIYVSNLGNISVTQILPVTDSEIEESNESKYQLSDENSSKTEESLSCLMIPNYLEPDYEIELKETDTGGTNKKNTYSFSKLGLKQRVLPRPKISIAYDFDTSMDQVSSINTISTTDMKTTVNQDVESKLNNKVQLNEHTQDFKNERKIIMSTAMMPGSLLFHKSEVESKSIVNNKIKTLTTQKLPTHVILSDLKLKRQQYTESNKKDYFVKKLQPEPTSLVSSEQSDSAEIYKTNEEAVGKICISAAALETNNTINCENVKNVVGVDVICLSTKPFLDRPTSFQNHIVEKSNVRKIKYEDSIQRQDMLVCRTTTDTSSIMKPEKKEKGTNTSSTKIMLLDTKTSTTDIENIIKTEFMIATQKAPISSSKINTIAIEKKTSCSFCKFTIEDENKNFSNKHRSIYCHDINLSAHKPILDTKNGKNMEKYYKDISYTDICYPCLTKSNSTVISDIQETVEKLIINDLLDMGNKYDSDIVDKNMTSVISKHIDSNLKPMTLLCSQYADNLNFVSKNDSYVIRPYESVDNAEDSLYCDVEPTHYKQQFHGQSTLNGIENIENDYALTAINHQNNRWNDHENKHSEKVITPGHKNYQDADDIKELRNLLHKVTKTEKMSNQVKPILSGPLKHKPEISLAPEKVQENTFAHGGEDLSSYRTKLQNSVGIGTETNTDLFRLNTSKNNSSEQEFEDDDYVEPFFTSSLGKKSPGKKSYKKDYNKKVCVIPNYLKDVPDDIKAIMSDLVKPVMEVETVENKYIQKKSSVEIQTNLFTSSQIDLQPISSYIIIPNQPSKNITTPKSTNHTNFPSSIDTASPSLPSELNSNKIKGITTLSGVIQFDPSNPLNNVLIPSFKLLENQNYRTSKYPETVVNPLSKQKSGYYVKSHPSSNSNLEFHNNSRLIPDHLSPVSLDGKDIKKPLKFSQAVDTFQGQPKTKEINTVIAMQDNKTLLDDISSLTLVNTKQDKGL